MPDIAAIVAWEVKGFLFTLFAMVALKLLTGEINMGYLFYGRKNDTGQPIVGADGKMLGRKRQDTPYFSPERVQLLVFTLAAAFSYLTQVLNNAHPGTLPPVPDSWLAVLGGSNLVYLGGKAYSRLWPASPGAHEQETL